MTDVRSRSAFTLALALALSGCAATTTAISKRSLDVQTKMTDSIFLEPVTTPDRTVLVEVRNSSDRPQLDVASAVRAALAARGYRLVDDPGDAHFLLQAERPAGRAHVQGGG
jgi:starvation-inducible outer membrane lipoprotein